MFRHHKQAFNSVCRQVAWAYKITADWLPDKIFPTRYVITETFQKLLVFTELENTLRLSQNFANARCNQSVLFTSNFRILLL
jgi:hypothetical protein